MVEPRQPAPERQPDLRREAGRIQGGHAPRREAWWGLAALLAIALLLRILGLGSQSLWVDEAFSVHYAKPDASLTWNHLLDNLHGPLHALVLHYWMRIAGTSEAMLRLPSVVASLLSIPAFWFLARRAWGKRVAWIGSALLAVSPFHIWYAQEARNYAFLILFAILAESAFQRLITEGPRRGLLVQYGLALLGGFLSNLSMAFLVVQQGVRLLLFARPGPADRGTPREGAPEAAAHSARPRARALLPSIVVVWLLVALCLSPWAVRFYQHQVKPSALLTTEAVPSDEKLRDETTDSILGLPYAIYTFAAGYSFGPARRELWTVGQMAAVRNHWGAIALTTLVFGFLWVAGLVRCWRVNRRDAVALLLWQVLPLLLLLFLAARNVKVINPRYVSVAFPAFVATVAWGVSRRPLGLIAAALALAISLISVGRALTMEIHRKEDYRSASVWLLREMHAGDAFLSLAVDQPMRLVYMRDELRENAVRAWEDFGKLVTWEGVVAIAGRGQGSYEKMLRSWRPGQRLFVLLAREWVRDPTGTLEADLRRHGRVLEEKRWTGVRVLVIEKPPEADAAADPDAAGAPGATPEGEHPLRPARAQAEGNGR